MKRPHSTDAALRDPTGTSASLALAPLAVAALVEGIPMPAGVCDGSCRLFYGNRLLLGLGLDQMTRQILCREVQRALAAFPVTREATTGRPVGSRVSLVAASTRRYRITVAPLGLHTDGETSLFLLCVSPSEADATSADVLRRQFEFTKQESRVGSLLAQGKRNAAIAAELRISEFTARRHTERIMAKLGVKSRAEIAARILGLVGQAPADDQI